MSEEDGLYIAGHVAPPGRYRRLEATAGQEIVLERPDVLPASLDGRVAVYARVTAMARPGASRGAQPRSTRERRPIAID